MFLAHARRLNFGLHLAQQGCPCWSQSMVKNTNGRGIVILACPIKCTSHDRLRTRRRKGSGDLPGLQSWRFGPSRVEWWVRLPHASANCFTVNHLARLKGKVTFERNDWPPRFSMASRWLCGITCAYILSVVFTSAWRNWFCNTVRGTLASTSSLARPCLNACNPVFAVGIPSLRSTGFNPTLTTFSLDRA